MSDEEYYDQDEAMYDDADDSKSNQAAMVDRRGVDSRLVPGSDTSADGPAQVVPVKDHVEG